MKTLLKTLIVDDEAAARRSLKSRLGRVGGFEVLAEAGTGLQAIELIRKLKPDLVFLDIQMPGMDGFDVLRALPPSLVINIVFVTAFDDYAIRAFRTHGLDYLLKPFRDDHCASVLQQLGKLHERKHVARRKRSMADLIQQITAPSRSDQRPTKSPRRDRRPGTTSYRLAIHDGGRTLWLEQEEIEWIDAAGDYMCVHAGGETYIMRKTMKSLEQELDPSILQRIHRSTIVNVNEVGGMRPHINGEYFLDLRRGHTVKLSRSYRNRLRHFKQFRRG